MKKLAESEDRAQKRSTTSDIKSVSFTFRVLSELARAEEPIGVSELARRVGESRAAVHKHLITLKTLGMVMQTAKADRYRLGWRLVELGIAAEAQISITNLADPHMRRLRDATGLSAFMQQANGNRVVVSHSLPSENLIAVTIRKGLEAPLHGSAGGRVMLAFSSPELQRSVLAGDLESMSDRMLSDASEIRARLTLIREHMFDCTAGESPSGIHSIAAPVLDEQEHFVASIGIVGTQAQIQSPPQSNLVKLVQTCAASVSSALQSNAYDRIDVIAWD